MTQTLNFERAMQNNAKRQRLHEKKQGAIAETNAKLRFAAEEKAREEAKQKTIADAAAHILAKNNSQEAVVAKKRHNVWLHTIFPAKHAGIIAAKRNARSPEAISHTEKSMRTLHGCGKFNKRISLDDPWQPDISLLQLFGSWPNVGCIFSTESRPQVRCSPQLVAFILCSYGDSLDGQPDPQKALLSLLDRCFIGGQYMCKDSYPPSSEPSLRSLHGWAWRRCRPVILITGHHHRIITGYEPQAPMLDCHELRTYIRSALVFSIDFL